MNKIVIFSSLLLMLLASACRKKIQTTVTDLSGTWIRLRSDDLPSAIYDSMKVNLDATSRTATIIYIRDTLGTFKVGDVKWRNIVPARDYIYTFEEMGSDGLYYRGQIKLSSNFQELHLVNSKDANGFTQTWIR